MKVTIETITRYKELELSDLDKKFIKRFNEIINDISTATDVGYDEVLSDLMNDLTYWVAISDDDSIKIDLRKYYNEN